MGIHEYITTLPEILRNAGYYTGITQKFHMSPPWKFPYTARDPVHHDPEEFHRVVTDWIAAAGDRPFFIQANVEVRPTGPSATSWRDSRNTCPTTSGLAVPDDLPDTPELVSDLQEYFGCVQLADACAGRIIDALPRIRPVGKTPSSSTPATRGSPTSAPRPLPTTPGFTYRW